MPLTFENKEYCAWSCFAEALAVYSITKCGSKADNAKVYTLHSGEVFLVHYSSQQAE